LPSIAQAFKWGMPFARPRPRHWPLAAVAGLGLACSSLSQASVNATSVGDSPATAAEISAQVAARARAQHVQLLAIAWSYRAGAPLAAPPAIGPDGTVVVGSVDGYLHSLRRDGSFQWGYTLRGPIVGRPAIAANGQVFAAADPNGLYALEPDGTLAWVSNIAGGVTSPAVVDGEQRVWVTTGQGTLLGFSSHGGVVGFAHVGSARTLGPAALAGGGVAIASVNGDLKIAGQRAPAAHAVATAPVVELQSGADALFVLDGEGLARFDTAAGEERWSRTDVARVACSLPALVVVDEYGLGWLSPRGELVAHVAFAVGRHRSIACLANGAVLVADDAGSLVWLEASGIKARGTLPEGRLVSLDPTRDGLLVAAYRDGRVVALRPPD
jgi:outer membrane protein assembly factor BamB